MKKLKINIFLLSFTIFPGCLLAQDVNDEVTVKELKLQKEEIPAAVAKTVTSDLKNEEPVQWTLISELVKSYGLSALMTGEGDVLPDNYYVRVKTTNGSVYDAIYSPDGQLIRWKEKLKDEQLPAFIQSELIKDEYKDWKVVSDVYFIKEYRNTASKYYLVKIEKGRQKKNLYFNDNGMLLTEK
jgi:hypothetical protein